MRLAVVSHKPCWAMPESPSGWATDGGFPFQMGALASLFDTTELVVAARRRGDPPPGLSPLVPWGGGEIVVTALPEPAGRGALRKLTLLPWLVRHLPRLVARLRRADAVHAAVPGDLGTLGLLLALALGKPLLVRHCGTWGDRSTVANRLLAWLLPRLARRERTVVLATGGGSEPPEPGRPEVGWIFSTSITDRAWKTLPRAELPAGGTDTWTVERPLRLVTVGRLTAGKNQEAALRAVGLLDALGIHARLDLVGHGPAAGELTRLAERLGLTARVRFHGNVPHRRVIEILGAGHLFVFPTRVAEGFPKAVVEALGCGLPVVAPPVSVLPSLLAGGGGLLLETTDAETVAHAVADLAREPERLRRMGELARETSRGLTLEAWAAAIRERLEPAWGRLREPRTTVPGAGR